MYQSDIATMLCDGLLRMRSEDAGRIVIFPYNNNLKKRNELLFFFKPEVTTLPESGFISVLELAFKLFEKYGLVPTGSFILNGLYMDTYNLAAHHYGVINQIARIGVPALNSTAKTRFKVLFRAPVEETMTLGAFQFLKKYPLFDAYSLNTLWNNCEINKLAGGTYCAKALLSGNKIYILNGFHPFQLLHLTDPSSSLAILVFQSDLDWDILRTKMLGATNPKEAIEGSFRRILYEQSGRFGLINVNQSNNCAHLSAGPLEAFVEIQRFVSDHSNYGPMSPSDVGTWKYLISHGVEPDLLLKLISNPKFEWDSKRISSFDLTENMDLDECANFLKSQRVQLHKANA